MVMDVEAEIRDLKRRVGQLEGSFGFLSEQIKGVHRDLHAFQAETKQQFAKIDARLDKHDGRFDRLEKEVRTLRADLPGIVGAAVREGMRERPGKSRKTPE